jgi:hypothetical protein
METLFACIQFGGPWILVVMGAFVSLKPPRRENRRSIWIWIVAFGFVGTANTGVQVQSDNRDRNAREVLRVKLTGGDNFAFFTVEPKIAPNGENYLTVTTTGQMPFFDCSVRFLSPNGGVIHSREWSIRPLPKTTARFNHTTLPLGRYRADCVMGEKSWQQHFEFDRTPNGIDQVFWVEKDNQIVKEGP